MDVAGEPVSSPPILVKDRESAKGKDRSFVHEWHSVRRRRRRVSDLAAFRSRSAYRTTVCDRVARGTYRNPVGASRPQGRRASKANSCLSLAPPRGGFPARHTKTRENDECIRDLPHVCLLAARSEPQIYEPPSKARRLFESVFGDVRGSHNPGEVIADCEIAMFRD